MHSRKSNRWVAHRIRALGCTLLVSSQPCWASGKESHKFVDKNVAGITIGKDHRAQVTKIWGKGTPCPGFGHGDSYLYVSARDSAFLRVDFCDGGAETVVITAPAASKYKLKGASLGSNRQIVTGKGVKLGDSPSRVKQIYGPPTDSESTQDQLKLTYSTDSEHDPNVSLSYNAYLTFKKGKLVEIELHDGE